MYKKACTYEELIIIKQEPLTPDFPEFVEFYSPFGDRLRGDNRWVITSRIIPWDFIQEEYGKKFKSMKIGAPAKKARVAFGALFIQQKLKLTDQELVLQIIENPYLQYFLGYENGYSAKKPFDPSLLVYFRRRLSADILAIINEKMLENNREVELEEVKKKTTRVIKQLIKANC